MTRGKREKIFMPLVSRPGQSLETVKCQLNEAELQNTKLLNVDLHRFTVWSATTEARNAMNSQHDDQNRNGTWLAASLAWHGGTVFLYPAFICGCHFHLAGLIVGMLPVGWAGYTLLSYSGLPERLLAYANSMAALGWFYLLWDSNLRFLYR